MSTIAKALNEATLKDMMPTAVVSRTLCTDFDTCTSAGVYKVTSNTHNHPTGAYQWGVLIVFATIDDCWTQIYSPHNSEDLFIRIQYSANTRNWSRYSGTLLSAESSGGVIYYPYSAESEKGGWPYERSQVNQRIVQEGHRWQHNTVLSRFGSQFERTVAKGLQCARDTELYCMRGRRHSGSRLHEDKSRYEKYSDKRSRRFRLHHGLRYGCENADIRILEYRSESLYPHAYLWHGKRQVGKLASVRFRHLLSLGKEVAA